MKHAATMLAIATILSGCDDRKSPQTSRKTSTRVLKEDATGRVAGHLHTAPEYSRPGKWDMHFTNSVTGFPVVGIAREADVTRLLMPAPQDGYTIRIVDVDCQGVHVRFRSGMRSTYDARLPDKDINTPPSVDYRQLVKDLCSPPASTFTGTIHEATAEARRTFLKMRGPEPLSASNPPKN